MTQLGSDEVRLDGGVLSDTGFFRVLCGTCRGRQAVIKVVADPTRADLQEVERTLERELSAMQRLDHPSVARALGLWRHPDGRMGLVREFAPGESLAEIIKRCQVRQRFQGARQWSEPTREIIRQVGDALSHAHGRRVFHNDITPENVIVRRTDDGHIRAVLVDFGMAGPDAQGGTVLYVAPERIEGRPANARSEVYSFGLLLYKMLTGTLPYDAGDVAGALLQRKVPVDQVARDNAIRAWSSIPAEVRGVISKALAFDPRQRYRSVSAMLAALGIRGRGGRRRWGFLAAALAATALAVAVTVPVGRGLMADSLMGRPDAAVCRAELDRHARRICRGVSPYFNLRQHCWRSLTTLAAPDLCASRVKELASCAAEY